MKHKTISTDRYSSWGKLLFVIALVLILIGTCSFVYGQSKRVKTQQAKCELTAIGEDSVSGTVWFIKKGNAIRIKADVYNLSPGKHGIHIYEYGDCSLPGGHYNPNQTIHNSPIDPNRHTGDLGNLFADSTGHAHLEYSNAKLTLKGKESIIGRSVIVHKDEDDYMSQPDGKAGAAIACGVIGWSANMQMLAK